MCGTIREGAQVPGKLPRCASLEPCRQSEQSQGTAAWCAVGVLYLPSGWAGMLDAWLRKQVIPRE